MPSPSQQVLPTSGQCRLKVASLMGEHAWSQDYYWPPEQPDELGMLVGTLVSPSGPVEAQPALVSSKFNYSRLSEVALPDWEANGNIPGSFVRLGLRFESLTSHVPPLPERPAGASLVWAPQCAGAGISIPERDGTCSPCKPKPPRRRIGRRDLDRTRCPNPGNHETGTSWRSLNQFGTWGTDEEGDIHDLPV